MAIEQDVAETVHLMIRRGLNIQPQQPLAIRLATEYGDSLLRLIVDEAAKAGAGKVRHAVIDPAWEQQLLATRPAHKLPGSDKETRSLFKWARRAEAAVLEIRDSQSHLVENKLPAFRVGREPAVHRLIPRLWWALWLARRDFLGYLNEDAVQHCLLVIPDSAAAERMQIGFEELWRLFVEACYRTSKPEAIDSLCNVVDSMNARDISRVRLKQQHPVLDKGLELSLYPDSASEWYSDIAISAAGIRFCRTLPVNAVHRELDLFETHGGVCTTAYTVFLGNVVRQFGMGFMGNMNIVGPVEPSRYDGMHFLPAIFGASDRRRPGTNFRSLSYVTRLSVSQDAHDEKLANLAAHGEDCLGAFQHHLRLGENDQPVDLPVSALDTEIVAE